MSLTLDQITDAALELPADSKISLAEKLVESLASDQPAEIERLWSAEAVRRRDEVRSGRVKAIPGAEVLEEVRSLVGR
ncbi:MAG TPA: addiction module protein [Pyrinomonadaceae bacterium]|nr:addiction module protein [Pyrinomonadaceae bacterium]